MDIVRKLMVHMDKSEGSHYRDELLSKIVEICSQSDYQHITNFEWFEPHSLFILLINIYFI
jgi:AP-3 complex subunit delta-1